MKPSVATVLCISRRGVLALSVALLGACAHMAPVTDPMPSWNDGAAKQAIVQFVRKTTEPASPQFVPAAQRVATFDQDGTLWVEQPMYAQVAFALDRVKDVVKAQPALANEEPFRAVVTGDRAAMAKFTEGDLLKIVGASQAGLTIEAFREVVKAWAATAKHPKFQRPYTELVYAPMLEAMKYLRANGYRTYIATGGGQEFVRAFAEAVYGVPPEQVIGSMLKVDYAVRDGVPTLTNAPAAFFVNDKAGKPVGINMMIGQRPQAAFGNSDGDQQMLEWTNGRHRRAPGHAGAARRRAARICLRAGQRPAAQQDRHVHPAAVRRSAEEGLDRHQHQERLEARLRL